MTKEKLLFIAMLLFSTVLHAQSKQEVADIRIGNYMVRLIPNPDNTFGYQILEGSKVVLHQKTKPYSNDQKGFHEKQNAMVVGIWQATGLNEGKDNLRSLDSKKAKDMGITKEDL